MDRNQANINMLLNLGDRLIEMNLYEEAVKVYADIVKINRTYSQAWSLLGECLVVLGRDEEAIDAFDHCLETQDDPYGKAARWQVAMAISRLGSAYKGFYYKMDTFSLSGTPKQPKTLDLSQFSWICKYNLLIIRATTDVYIDVGAWHTDKWGRDKVGWWTFKWTDKGLFFIHAFDGEFMIGEASTQDFAQTIAERWLDGWLKSCKAISQDLPIEITDVTTQTRFSFLLRDKNHEKYKCSFLWKDDRVIFLPDEMAIGYSEIEAEALQIARIWLRDKIYGNE